MEIRVYSHGRTSPSIARIDQSLRPSRVIRRNRSGSAADDGYDDESASELRDHAERQ